MQLRTTVYQHHGQPFRGPDGGALTIDGIVFGGSENLPAGKYTLDTVHQDSGYEKWLVQMLYRGTHIYDADYIRRGEVPPKRHHSGTPVTSWITPDKNIDRAPPSKKVKQNHRTDGSEKDGVASKKESSSNETASSFETSANNENTKPLSNEMTSSHEAPSSVGNPSSIETPLRIGTPSSTETLSSIETPSSSKNSESNKNTKPFSNEGPSNIETRSITENPKLSSNEGPSSNETTSSNENPKPSRNDHPSHSETASQSVTPVQSFGIRSGQHTTDFEVSTFDLELHGTNADGEPQVVTIHHEFSLPSGFVMGSVRGGGRGH
jgi:hypothetical protein